MNPQQPVPPPYPPYGPPPPPHQQPGQPYPPYPPYPPYGAPPPPPGHVPTPPGDQGPVGVIPYAGAYHPAADGGVWNDGIGVLMDRHARLPDVCIKCGQPATERLWRNLAWHNGAVYLLILLNILIYAIVALCVRKTASVEVPLCPVHARRRRTMIAIGWLLALAGAALFIGGIVLHSSGRRNEDVGLVSVLVGLGTLLVAAIVGIVASQPVTPRKIDDRFIRLRVGPAFRSQLPPAPFQPY